MNTVIRATRTLIGSALILSLPALACTPAPAQQASKGVRTAQAAVEKAQEAAQLASQQAPTAGQQTTDTGDVVNPDGDVYIAEDQTVEGNAIAVNGAARVHGKVKGSVIAVGGSIFLAGGSEVGGDILSFGGTITREPKAKVGGTISEMPDAEPEEQPAEPAVEEQPAVEEPPAEEVPSEQAPTPPSPRHRPEIVQFGQPVSVGADEIVDGDVVAMGGPVDVDGEVKGDVVSLGGPVDVGGKVHGDVVAIGGPLSLNDEAEVHGDAVTVGGPLNAAEGAKVSGQTVTVGGPLGGIPWGIIGKMMGQGRHAGPVNQFLSPCVRLLGGAAAWLGQSLVMLILVALIVLVFPRQTETVATTMGQQPGRALLYGLVSWLLVLPILAILFVLIITWILIPVYLLVLVALLILGYVGVSQLLGGRIVELCKWRVTSLLGLTLVGFVALSLVDLVGFLPFIRYMAAIVTVVVLVFSLGGALMTRFGTDPSGTWLADRTARSGGVGGSASPSAAPGSGLADPPEPRGPSTPAEGDFDDATRRALREVEGAAEPEAAEPPERPDEPPIDDLDEAARNALAELPPDEEPEGPQSPRHEAPGDGEPEESAQ